MFSKQILDFNSSILTLRDFTNCLDPILKKKLEESDDKLNVLVRLASINKMLQESQEPHEKLLSFKAENEESLKRFYGEDAIIESSISDENIEDERYISIKVTVHANGETLDLKPLVDELTKIQKHCKQLYVSSFINLLCTVERFFSQVLHYHYDKHPQAACIENKQLTLSQLREYNTISDAVKYLIDFKIDEVLRGDFMSWMRILKEEIRLETSLFEPSYDVITEIYQRRNLLVHNGGIVNSIYMNKVKSEHRLDLKIGDELSIDIEYLDNSICQLHSTFILIAAMLWQKESPTDKERADVIGDIVYENLLQSRWGIAQALSEFIIKDKNIPCFDKEIAQINRLLCLKRQYGKDRIVEVLEKLDLSDKADLIRVGYYALLDDFDNLVLYMKKCLNANNLTMNSIDEFPILQEFRESDAYSVFVESQLLHDKEIDTK